MFLALVILFYIVLLYVVCVLYGQLLVLVIQPCCSSSLSYVHVMNLYLYFDERNK